MSMHTTTQRPILEMVVFKTVPGVADADLLRASDAVQAWLAEQPGYLHRELAKGEDGRWVDLVHWTRMDHALAAAEQITQQSCAADFMQMLDGASIQMVHVQQVRSYLPQAA
jgi:hypothetical protein